MRHVGAAAWTLTASSFVPGMAGEASRLCERALESCEECRSGSYGLIVSRTAARARSASRSSSFLRRSCST